MPFSVALSAAASAVAGVFTTSKVLGFIIKAGILFGASWLLRPKQDKPEIREQTHTETFSSGPARWVIGRQKVGGVIMFWGEDWNVKGTERRNEFKGGADDLHLVVGLSEGDLEGIEAVWVGNDRFDVKFHDAEKTRPVRREEDLLDPDASDYRGRLALLPLELDPGVNAYFDEVRDQWRESESLESRVLNRDDDDDAEIIRKAHLGGAISIIPYLAGNDTGERFQSLRHYTDDLENRLIREGDDLNNPFKALPFADQWTTEHRLQGIACVHVRLRQWVKHNFDRRVFKSGTPNVSFLVKGMRLTYPDPDNDTGMVTGWTENAAAVRYWWHTERRGIPATAIDRASFVQAFKDCDAKILPDRPAEWPDGVEPEWSKDDSVWGFSKYSINGVLSGDADPATIESDFDRQWQGQVVEDGGRLFYYPGVDRPVTGSVSGADVLDYPTIAPAPSLADRVNAVTMSIRQSSYHDYNSHALAEIRDDEKRMDVDRDFHLPTDLGEWRWTINPAAAYSLALINLRRARFATTITLKLNPGDATDPVKYLKMSPGLVYQVDFPEEGIVSRRMALQSKRINPDMTVDATFLDSPVGLYADSYQLPELIPQPPYTPSRPGARPPKPTELVVTSTARSSSDGSTHFRIKASVADTAFRKVFRLQAGDDSWEATTIESSHVFEVNVPRQIMEITVRHLDATGIDSLPVKEIFTPDYSGLVLPAPRWKDAFFHGGTLRMSFEADEFVAGVSGVEVRYIRQDLDDTSDLDRLDDGTWAILGEHLTTKPVQIIRGQEIVAEALVHRSGHYNLFARFISSVSGSEPVRGPISAAREIAIDIVVDPADVYEAAPLWDVAYAHLHKWESKFGNTKGESLMYPAYDPADTPITPTALTSSAFTLAKADWDRVHFEAGKAAAAVKVVEDGGYTGISDGRTYYARKGSGGGVYQITLYGTEAQALVGGSTGRRNISGNGTIGDVRFAVDLDSIPFDVWNGYVANSAVTAEPRARWPFGRVQGYDETFDTSNRNAATGLLRPDRPGDSTWFTTPAIDLGSSRRVEVRAETYAFAPGTDLVSNITFGGITIPSQRYKVNTTIISLTMPEAQRAIGSVVYSIVGLPAGLSFDPATRALTGTPTIANTTGKASYTATDALGGSVTLDFDWGVQASLDAPPTPQNLTLVEATSNSLKIRWDEVASTNWYRVEYQKVSGGNLQGWAPLFDNETTITGLDSSSQYRFRVQAVNGAGASQYTAFQVRSTLAEIQVPTLGPGNVRVGSVNDRAAIIRWNTVSGANRYEVRWKLQTDASYPPTNLRSYGANLGQIDPLIGQTYYDVQVRAVNERGAGPWSTPVLSVLTTTSTAAAPTITITTHSSGLNEKRPYLSIVTNELTGETGTEIAVRILRDAENGGDADLPTIYPPRGTGPFLYFNGVGPGGTYLVRVRKVFEPAGGIGLIRYSGWAEQTLTFGGVPAQPLPPRNADLNPLPTSIQFRIYRTPTATKYRVRYWKDSDPDAVLQFTTNDNYGSGGNFVYNLSGLADNETYRFTCEAGNDEGWSIPSEPGSTTLPILWRTPLQITGLKEAPLSESSAIFAWDPDPYAESYELDGSGAGVVERVGQTGITDTNFILDGLQPDTRWRIRIRGYNSRVTSGSKYGPWRSFTAFNTPPVPTGANPYPYRSMTLTASQNATEPRKIDWTATIPHAANVIGLQIRYGQHYFGSDAKVTSWTIGHENFFNITVANDGDSYSGSFDPGFSSRLWEVNVRLLLSSGGTYDGGFTGWWHLSNSAQFRQTPTSPLTTISNAFVNGAKPMTAPTPRVYQLTTNFSFARNTPWMHIDWAPNTEDFESPDSDGGKSRNELRITYRGKLRTLPGFPYPTGGSANYQPWAATSYFGGNELTHLSRYTFAEIRQFISIQPYYELNPVPIGVDFSVQIVRHEVGRASVSSPVITYTTLDPATAPEVDPGTPTLQLPTYSGQDVVFRWGPVAEADGYEVLLLEDSLYGVTPSDDEGTLEQTGASRTWTKPSARNEHFTIKVRSYRGNFGGRRYSSYATYHYSPPTGVVGKITGMHARVNGPDLEVLWNALPADNATTFRYVMSTSTDNGATWGAAATIPIAAWSEDRIEHTIDDAATEDTLIRIRGYRVENGTRVYSSSWTTFHWNPTPSDESGNAPAVGELNPINGIASIAANGYIHLDWSSPVSNNDHPAPSRYRIQQSASATGPWSNYQSGISGDVDQWDVIHSPTTARWFRVRPETFTADGEWVTIPFVPDEGVTIGNTDATGDSTYTTMTATWTPTENAQEYELQWKSGTGGFGGASGGAGIDTGQVTTISDIEGGAYTIGGLEAGTHYQMRVRGKAGDTTGAWSSTIDIDTLRAVNLPAPSGVTLTTTAETLRINWAKVTDATGYQVRIDAKVTSSTTWTTNVIVRNFSASTLATDVNRIDFGNALAYSEFDVRARVKGLFLDSPENNYSAYQSVRWSQGQYTAPPTVTLTITQGSALAPHTITGVNASGNISYLPRVWSTPHNALRFRYTVPKDGAYTFTITGAGGTLELYNTANNFSGSRIAGSSSPRYGPISVSASLTTGLVDIQHYPPSLYPTERPISIRIDGPGADEILQGIVTTLSAVDVVQQQSRSVGVVLNKRPSANVVVNAAISPAVTGLSVSPSSRTFTLNDWSTRQSFSVRAAASAPTGTNVGTLLLTGTGNLTKSVPINVTAPSSGLRTLVLDKDSVSLVRGGASQQIGVKLSRSPVFLTVKVSLTLPSSLGGTIRRDLLTFNNNNWDSYQYITLRAVSTGVTGTFTYTLSTTDNSAGIGDWSNITKTFQVHISTPTIATQPVLSATSINVTEGASQSVNMRLSANPTTNLIYTISVANGASAPITASPSSLTFTSTNWNTDQAITITGKEDTALGNRSGTVNIAGNNQTRQIAVTVVNNDTPTIVTNPSSLEIDEGESATLNLQLSHAPTSAVTLTLTSSNSDVTLSPSTLTFQTNNYNTNQAVTVSAAEDDDASDDTGNISITASGGGYASVNASVGFTVDDDETVSLVYIRTGNVGTGKIVQSSSNNRLVAGSVTIPSSEIEYRSSSNSKNYDVEADIYPSALSYRVSVTINSPNTPFTKIVAASIDRRDTSYSFNAPREDVASASQENPTSSSITLTLGPFTIPSNRVNNSWLHRISIFCSDTTSTATRSNVTFDVAFEVVSSGTSTPEGSANSEAAGAIAFGTSPPTQERVSLSSETYAHVEQPALNPAVLPTFFGYFPTQCWLSGSAIDDWEIPPVGNGLPPYTITATGLPTGITFDADTRTISGTPTQSSPLGGTATFTATDANGNADTQEMDWALARATPSGWSDVQGGLGRIDNPFQIHCNTKGNIRGLLWTGGATNAHDIEEDEGQARGLMVWFKCPTTLPHTCRLYGVGAVDFDLVIKVGDDWYFSDTDDDMEMLSVPGHEDGALIGVYRYAATTTSVGSHNTGDPITLEWFTDHAYLPTEEQGAGALSASASAERGANANATTPGESETDVYVLHRASNQGAWTRSAAPLGNGWVDVGVDARQIRYEVHLKKWENRALRRFTSFHRDKE